MKLSTARQRNFYTGLGDAGVDYPVYTPVPINAPNAPSIPVTGSTVIDTILNTIGGVANFKNQQAIFDAQLKAYKQNLLTSVNPAGVQPPIIYTGGGYSQSNGLSTPLMIGLGVGALALVLLLSKGKR